MWKHRGGERLEGGKGRRECEELWIRALRGGERISGSVLARRWSSVEIEEVTAKRPCCRVRELRSSLSTGAFPLQADVLNDIGICKESPTRRGNHFPS